MKDEVDPFNARNRATAEPDLPMRNTTLQTPTATNWKYKIRLLAIITLLAPLPGAAAEVNTVFESSFDPLAALQDPLKALDRIGIHQDDDGARLVHAGTKAPFFVKGFNYFLHRPGEDFPSTVCLRLPILSKP